MKIFIIVTKDFTITYLVSKLMFLNLRTVIHVPKIPPGGKTLVTVPLNHDPPIGFCPFHKG